MEKLLLLLCLPKQLFMKAAIWFLYHVSGLIDVIYFLPPNNASFSLVLDSTESVIFRVELNGLKCNKKNSEKFRETFISFG